MYRNDSDEVGYEFVPPTTDEERSALDARRSEAVRRYMAELDWESKIKAIAPSFLGRLWVVLMYPSLIGFARMLRTPSEVELRFARLAHQFEWSEIEALMRRT
jgi:hypothetical protein